MRTSQTLPIESFSQKIIDSVKQHSNVIIMAEPGAGKTTRVPVYLATHSQKWIVLQPRRWAAKLTASRIAETEHWKIGEEIGYQIRFESRVSKNSRIVFMTEGVFLRKLISDPELVGFTGVILDEFHERSLDLDLSLSLLKEIQGSLRPDLKILVMSATLDPSPIQKFLEDCEVLSIPGRTFPVGKRYLGEVSIESAMKTVLTETEADARFRDGDILVFLPGSYEINRAVEGISRVAESLRLDLDVLPLYASLPERDQQRVFNPQDSSRRRVICSTNIAETSITLPNVKVVVDVGLAKIFRTDPQLGQDRLETLRISRASAEQRAGRAGRVSEGMCYRLWSEGEQNQLRSFEVPEIHRVHLGQALLMLSEFGVRDFRSFSWYETPRSSLLDFSERELIKLGFLKDGAITEAGRAALKLPVAPGLAKLILLSRSQGDPAFGARFAAFLESRGSDLPLQHGDDLVKRLNQLHPADQRVADQLFGNGMCPKCSGSWEDYERLLLAAMPGRVFIGEKLVGGRKIQSRKTQLPPFGFVIHSREKSDRGVTLIEIQSFVEISEATLNDFVEKQTRTIWNEELQRVQALSGNFFEDIPLGRITDAAPNREEAKAVLLAELLKDPEGRFSRNDEFKTWYERVKFFNLHSSEKLTWNWSDVLDPLAEGKNRMDQIAPLSVMENIEGSVDYALKRKFEEWAPEKLEVPSGSRHRLDYEGAVPKLSVRLQEIFGWLDSPRIAGGEVKILIELLSPGFKPMQLTQDLKSFWANTYFEIKKELKARYPKHSWPEDPLTAKPEAKGRRKF